jgi:hypothetical protein
MNTLECNSESVTANYVPPPLGNGDLNLALDMEGIQRQKAWHTGLPTIWWAGRRYNDLNGRPMIPFGHLGHAIPAPPTVWSQRLSPQSASMETECVYEGGRRLRTEAFVHHGHPLIAMRKHFEGAYGLTYALSRPGAEGEPPARMRFAASENPHGVEIVYEIEGLSPRRGIISFFCDRPVKVEMTGHRFHLTAEGPQATFFLAFADAFDGDDPRERSGALRRLALENGFGGLFATHAKAWADYWGESRVEIPGSREADVYAVSQYHLRISSTRWSIPAGGISNHWQGAYYAFDEFFPFMGLATSGHFTAAARIPAFRHQVLRKACLRSFQHWGEENAVDYGARFHFMCDENGDECTPSGYWLEHIFQMANVALCAWELFRFRGDEESLREQGYPVIAKCAEFFRTQTLYELGGGRLIVGKCTDLERLGPARENAFMTTCGAIATFEAAASAAGVLGVDGEEAALWRELAKRLRAALPVEEGRYVPHPRCSKKSIAVFAGTFPYPVLPSDDPRQAAAITDFIASENEFGNMYPVGKSICAWYAAWKGLVFARLGRLEDARACARAIAEEANCFSEIFEVRDPPMCPWFCTGEGTYIQLVNECLVQSEEGVIEILSYPAPDYSFRLAAVGGLMVDAAFVCGALIRLRLDASIPYTGEVRLPDGKVLDLHLVAGSSTSLI